MKRKILLFILLCVTNLLLFGIDDSKIRYNILNDSWFNSENVTENDIKKIIKLDDNKSVAVVKLRDSFILYFLYYYDGEYEDWTEDTTNTLASNFQINYIEKLENINVLIGDFGFNEKLQTLTLDLHSEALGANRIAVGGFLSVLFPAYKQSVVNGELPKRVYFGNNKRIDSVFYLSLNDIKFGLLGDKRGIFVKTIGQVYYERDCAYEMDISNDDGDHWRFFYWDKEKLKYILDEQHKNIDISNQNIPEDYFAYNGLKFSKLDSKLSESDLKYLDKSQLRLMRNAVYARHGRTFKSVDLQSLWECYTWYKKNPNYNDSLLTDIDKYNIELIQKYESK